MNRTLEVQHHAVNACCNNLKKLSINTDEVDFLDLSLDWSRHNQRNKNILDSARLSIRDMRSNNEIRIPSIIEVSECGLVTNARIELSALASYHARVKLSIFVTVLDPQRTRLHQDYLLVLKTNDD